MMALSPSPGNPGRWPAALLFARTWTSDSCAAVSRRSDDGLPIELGRLYFFRESAQTPPTSRRARDAPTADLTMANERLEATNKELEAFSYSVSHDLRVPLRAIDGFSRILLEDYSSKLDAEGRRLLNVVRDSTVKMARLIDDILAFSRAGRSEMTSARIDMDGLVRAVFEELEPAVAGRKLTFDIKPLAPAQGDAAMIRRVWTNLIDNAIKFTAPRPAPSSKSARPPAMRKPSTTSRTMARASTCNTPTNCSACSSGCMAPSSPAPASGSPSSSASSAARRAGVGRRQGERGRHVLFYPAGPGGLSCLTQTPRSKSFWSRTMQPMRSFASARSRSPIWPTGLYG